MNESITTCLSLLTSCSSSVSRVLQLKSASPEEELRPRPGLSVSSLKSCRCSSSRRRSSISCTERERVREGEKWGDKHHRTVSAGKKSDAESKLATLSASRAANNSPSYLLHLLLFLLELQSVLPQLVHHFPVQVHLVLQAQAGVFQLVGHSLFLLSKSVTTLSLRLKSSNVVT